MENLKTFGLVMPCYKSHDTLRRAVDSLLDQKDYPNWVLKVVFDGENLDGEAIMKEYTDPRISYMTIEHKGACAARNAGARELLKNPDVAYLSFFSSDFKALPGMLTTWANAFDEHPECGFVYGGYDVYKPGTEEVIGRVPGAVFDYRQLQTANYIDGGFPVRRECYVEWDEDIYSLNDWDFWLNICDKGVKGYYMGNVTYVADAPKAGGLSMDSHNNWLERVDKVRVKHKIPNRRICVCSMGAPFHAQRLAKIIDADYQVDPSFKPHKYDMIYLLGMYVSSIDAATRVFNTDREVVKAVHWIGTDVYMLKGLMYHQLQQLRSSITDKMEYNLAEYVYTARELEDMRIRSGIGENTPILALPVEEPREILPQPDKFSVAVYMPQTPDAEWKYYTKLMEDIARALPDIQFNFFGGGKGEEKNVKGLGWCDTQEVIKNSSILLRITQHDGLPVAPIEFLMHNRQVITNTPMAHTEWFNVMGMHSMNATTGDNYCNVKDRLINRIRRLKAVNNEGYNWDKIRKYYLENCGVARFKGQVDNMLNRKPIEELPLCGIYYKAGSEHNDMLNLVKA